MAIDARALVEPTVAKARIHAHHQVILFAILHKVADIEAEGRVAVVVSPDEASIQKNQRAAEGPVEVDGDAAAPVCLRQIEDAPVPADACLRVAPAERLVAVRILFLVANEGQLDRPIVGQVERAPPGVVELGRREFKVARLVEVALPFAETEVVGRVGAVSLEKLPAEIEEQPFARRNRGNRLCGWCVRKGGKERVGAGNN